MPYPGYRNRFRQWDEIDGIRILRVKTFLSANKGFARRTINYLSYLLSASLFAPLAGKVDVVVSTSPQFFCGLAGYGVSRLKGVPWVLEIRDLWPESIIALGAVRNRRLITLLEGIESFMYLQAQRIVSLTNSFKRHIASRGVQLERIEVIMNGADQERFIPQTRDNAFREEHGLTGKFVASYIGTHGMAHGLRTILQAAELLRKEEKIVFLLVGDGAERLSLLAEKERLGLDNVIMLPQQPKERIPEIIAASDTCLVLLRNMDLFKGVVPSKMFESMAMARPLIIGVEGESRGIVESAECGIHIDPENPAALAEAVLRLAGDSGLAARLGGNGHRFVTKHHDRDVLALRYLDLLREVAGKAATLQLHEKEMTDVWAVLQPDSQKSKDGKIDVKERCL
jgi:glycosyltransferase involved in cell wall biosynthesis